MLSHHGNCLSQQFDMFGEQIVAVPLQQVSGEELRSPRMSSAAMWGWR